MLQDIPIVWRPIRNRSYAGLLGEHEIAYVVRHEDERGWRWTISNCNGTGSTEFRTAETLDAAKIAVQAGVQAWFRQAGLLPPYDSSV